MYILTCFGDVIADTLSYQVTCKIQGISLAFYKYSRYSLQLHLYHAVTIIISTALSISKKKLKIIEAVEKGDKSHLDVAKEFSVAKSTVRLLCIVGKYN